MRERIRQNDAMRDLGHRVVIVGDGEFGQIAYEYLTHDSPHDVVGFSAERAFLVQKELYGLPVVPFEEIENHFPPGQFCLLIAVTYTQLNRVRARLYRAAKIRGYSLISYRSSRAFIWHNVQIGENCFIFENNVIQHHASIGNNVVLWSGNHIGHRARVGDHTYISSHAVISGYCEIGESCFFGVNSAVADGVKIADDCVIAAGTVVTRDTERGRVYKMDCEAKPRASSLALFRVKRADA